MDPPFKLFIPRRISCRTCYQVVGTVFERELEGSKEVIGIRLRHVIRDVNIRSQHRGGEEDVDVQISVTADLFVIIENLVGVPLKYLVRK